MFSSRKAAPPAFDNINQTTSFEEDDQVTLVQRAENAQVSSPLLPQPAVARSIHDPDVMAQAEMAKQYANEISGSRQMNPAVVEDQDAARLCIGSAIKMKGSVEDCGVLQVDGHFEASAQSNHLKVSESGIFVGDADVHNAEIIGRFEGNITVKDKLVIRATGVVTGTVKYGSIAIESGGRLSGDIQAILRNEPPVEAVSPEVVAAPVTPEPSPAPLPERRPLRLNLSDGQPDPSDTVAAFEPTESGA
jgi:cytoskeletal protein CcmA (bactofilin family)